MCGEMGLGDPGRFRTNEEEFTKHLGPKRLITSIKAVQLPKYKNLPFFCSQIHFSVKIHTHRETRLVDFFSHAGNFLLNIEFLKQLPDDVSQRTRQPHACRICIHFRLSGTPADFGASKKSCGLRTEFYLLFVHSSFILLFLFFL